MPLVFNYDQMWELWAVAIFNFMRIYIFNPSAAEKCALILPMSQVVISAVGKEKKCLECHCQKQASLLPSQIFTYPSKVLTVLKKMMLNKAIIKNGFYRTYAVPHIWGIIVSKVHMLYYSSQRG